MVSPDRALAVSEMVEDGRSSIMSYFEDGMKKQLSAWMDIGCDDMIPSCERKICDHFPSLGSGPSDPTVQRLNWYVPVSMMLGGVLVLIFLNDRSFMHWSGDIEILSVCIMMALLVSVPVLLDFLTLGPMYWKAKMGEEMYYNEVQLTGLYLLEALGVMICSFSAIRRWVYSAELREFDHSFGRQRAQGKCTQDIPAADEIVDSLRDLIAKCHSKSMPSSSELDLCFILAVLWVCRASVSLDLGDHYGDPWRMRLFNWGCFLFSLLIPGWIITIHLRLYFTGRKIAAFVRAMVRSAQKELTEEDRKNFFAYVLERVNVSAIVRFSRVSLNQLVYEALDLDREEGCWGRWMWTFGLRDVDDLTHDPDSAFTPGKRSLHSRKTIAIVIDAIQNQGMLSRRRQYLVKLLFLSVKGKDLTIVKMLLDASGGYENLYKLVHIDIDNTDIRNAIIEHMRVQAEVVRREVNGYFGVKIMSDIDDTLYASGGKFPYGSDANYPHHTIYPGILALYRAIDMASRRETSRLGQVNVVFLTARPHIYKDVGFGKTRREFERLVTDEATVQKMHELPTLLAGSALSAVTAFICGIFPCRCDWTYVGGYKFNQFQRFQQIYEEYDFIFSGDDGQGDLYAGLKMIEADQERRNDNTQSRLRAVLIHEVSAKGPKGRAPLTDVRGEDLEEWEERKVELRRGKPPLIFYNTHVGAALELVKARVLEPINDEVLAYTMQAAKEAFADAQLTSWFKWTKPNDQSSMIAAQKDLHYDLLAARNYLVSRNFDPQSLPKVDDAGVVGWPIDRLAAYFANHVQKTRVTFKDIFCFQYRADDEDEIEDYTHDDSVIIE